MNQEKFTQIIDATPLVSIDLVIEGPNNTFLLGRRLNRPAKGYWFVPGGRIRKNETLAEAFMRISKNELGIALSIHDAQLLGAYDHIYPDNVFEADGVNTHYVALGYRVTLPAPFALVADNQHDELQWRSEQALLADDQVHDNSKAYFLPR